MNSALLMFLIFLAALVVSWLLTKTIVARWKRTLEPTEKALMSVCVFGAVFFIVGGLSIAAVSVYRQFTHQAVSAVSETAEAIDDVRERASTGKTEKNGAGPSSAASPAEIQVQELEAKVAKWRTSRDKLKELLEQLKKDKASVLEKLGGSSDGNVANDPRTQALSNQLKEILRQTAICEKKYQDYDLAILKSEVQVRTLARRLEVDAGVSDTEIAELAGNVSALDESLGLDEESTLSFDLERALADELSRYRQERQANVPAPTGSTPSSDMPTSPDTIAEQMVPEPLLPKLAQAKAANDAGWIDLFDGKSLNGWEPDKHPEIWAVVQGAIVGRQPSKPSHLFYETAFVDFVVEAEVKINDSGSSGFYFRAKQGEKFPEGYEVQIIGTRAGKGRHTTGDLYGKAKVGRNRTRDDTWFKLRVTAKGNHITIALDDKTVLEYTDEQDKYRAGFFVLQCWATETEVHFRNLRVRPLQ